MRTNAVWLAVAGLLAATVVAAVWSFGLEPVYAHRTWSNRVRADLESLKHRRPAEVPDEEWEYMVFWTLNLHGNCGVHHTWVHSADRGPFLTELERRLKVPVEVATIDWIWDEYARI